MHELLFLQVTQKLYLLFLLALMENVWRVVQVTPVFAFGTLIHRLHYSHAKVNAPYPILPHW